MVNVSAAIPFTLRLPVYCKLASVALMSVTLPLIVNVLELFAPALMVAVPASVTSRTPLVTVNCVVITPAPASGSATDKPAIAVWVSSNTVAETGTVLTGASLSPLTVIVTVATLELALPS